MTATVIDAGDGLPLTVPALLRERVAARPEAVLLACDDDVLTYGEADRRSARLARGLLAIGAGKGTHVGILHPNGSEFVVAWLAAARIGAVSVPLSTFSTSAELATLLRNADVRILLSAVSHRSHDYVRALRAAVPKLDLDDAPPLLAPSVPALRYIAFASDGIAGADANAEPDAADGKAGDGTASANVEPESAGGEAEAASAIAERDAARALAEARAGAASANADVDAAGAGAAGADAGNGGDRRIDAGWTMSWLRRQGSAVDDDVLRAAEDLVSPADRMVIVHTSGSTSEPKGVIHTHGALIRHLDNLNQIRRYTPDEVLFSNSPFFWIGGFAYALLGTLVAGAKLVCSNAADAAGVLDVIERERPTMVNGFAQSVAHLPDDPTFAGRDLSSIRRGNLYPIMPPDVRPADPELRHAMLGMTETGSVCLVSDDESEQPEHRRGSFGRPAPGFEARVVGEDGTVCGPNQVGELHLRGPFMMEGYYGRERHEAFDADGWYHTGDLVVVDDEGFFYFKGRSGEMIKTAGANVSPREVEAAIRDVAGLTAHVIGIDDEARGQLVAAAVRVPAGRTVDADELRSRLREHLSAYKVPRRIVLLPDDQVPMMSSGKLNLRALKTLLATGRTAGGSAAVSEADPGRWPQAANASPGSDATSEPGAGGPPAAASTTPGPDTTGQPGAGGLPEAANPTTRPDAAGQPGSGGSPAAANATPGPHANGQPGAGELPETGNTTARPDATVQPGAGGLPKAANPTALADAAGELGAGGPPEAGSAPAVELDVAGEAGASGKGEGAGDPADAAEAADGDDAG